MNEDQKKSLIMRQILNLMKDKDLTQQKAGIICHIDSNIFKYIKQGETRFLNLYKLETILNRLEQY